MHRDDGGFGEEAVPRCGSRSIPWGFEVPAPAFFRLAHGFECIARGAHRGGVLHTVGSAETAGERVVVGEENVSSLRRHPVEVQMPCVSVAAGGALDGKEACLKRAG